MSSLGLESGVVRVVAYDPSWATLYRAEAERLRQLCTLPMTLEHVGSTSVPGLCAKPILDILIGHPSTVSALDYVPQLQQAGYEHRGDAGMAGHQFFRRGQPRAYHIHLVEEQGALWRDYLTFRDRLRADQRLASGYAELKQALAARYPRNREAYIEGKTDFVAEVLRRAR